MNLITGILNMVTSFIAGKIADSSLPKNTEMNIPEVKTLEDNEKNDSLSSRPSAGLDESRVQQDYSVTQKWHPGWKRELDQITEVVIHHTAGTGNIETLKKWMLGGERKDQYIKGISLFHFAIGRDGKIWKAGPITRWWYHSCSGKHDRFTIGIENIHKSGPFTDEQYENLFWLLFDYLPNYCPSFNRIVSHDYNYNTYSKMKKGCPGQDFGWGRLESEMTRRNIGYETHNFEEYTIKFPK